MAWPNYRNRVPPAEKAKAAPDPAPAVTPESSLLDAQRAQARAMIPKIQSEQPGLVATMIEMLEERRAHFEFYCRRWGDFLQVEIQDWPVAKRAETIPLTGLSIIFQEGRAPDTLGQSQFTVWEGNDSEGVPVEAIVYNVKAVTATGWEYANNGFAGKYLDVMIDGLARDAEDDRVIFGTVGTIRVPHGLGRTVYGQVLEALREGAPRSTL